MYVWVCMRVYVCSINNFGDGGYFKTKPQNSDNSKKKTWFYYHITYALS